MAELLRAGDAVVVPLLAFVLVTGAVLPFLVRHRRSLRASRQAEIEALRYGLHEPVTLHPVVDPAVCIGSGSCVTACPEGIILGLVDGQARAIAPARCIGHGLCERACPVEAIQLVFGSEKRGVDLPRIRGNFETNVDGIYVVGELGGMGLVGNAFEQGRQCVDGIRRERRTTPAGALDAVVVGCGPAGLSASLALLEAGLSFRTLEREPGIGGAVRHYPRKKMVLTRPVVVPGWGKLPVREVRKEELMDLWARIVRETGLTVDAGETVTGVLRHDEGGFVVRTDQRELRTARVILAIGRRGVPRRLDVPGEDLPKVLYALREPEAFEGDRLLVVGGGDSAVEAALALAERPGNEVKLSYRRDRFVRIKPRNHERLEAALHGDRLEVLWSTRVERIGPSSVVYANGGGPREIPNDFVFVFAGGELPTGFLTSCGIEIETKFGRA